MECQTIGRGIPEFGQSHDTLSSKSVDEAVTSLQTSATDTESEDEWKTFTKTIDTLENPVFAIDKTGVIILWNKAIEQLTGYQSGDMIGKGNREYAIPFFGEPRPMLVDYIVISTDKRLSGKFPGIKRIGNTFIGEMEKVKIHEKPMFLWSKGPGCTTGKAGWWQQSKQSRLLSNSIYFNLKGTQKKKFILVGYQVLQSRLPVAAQANRLLISFHHLHEVMASMLQTSGY